MDNDICLSAPLSYSLLTSSCALLVVTIITNIVYEDVLRPNCVKQYKNNVKFAYILRIWFALAYDFSTNRLLLILYYYGLDRCGHHLSVDATVVALILVISYMLYDEVLLH